MDQCYTNRYFSLLLYAKQFNYCCDSLWGVICNPVIKECYLLHRNYWNYRIFKNNKKTSYGKKTPQTMVNSWLFFLRVQTILQLHSTLNLTSHLSIIVEIPQVKPAHPIDTGKQGRVSWRPHHIINIIRVVFKGVERFVILKRSKDNNVILKPYISKL